GGNSLWQRQGTDTLSWGFDTPAVDAEVVEVHGPGAGGITGPVFGAAALFDGGNSAVFEGFIVPFDACPDGGAQSCQAYVTYFNGYASGLGTFFIGDTASLSFQTN